MSEHKNNLLKYCMSGVNVQIQFKHIGKIVNMRIGDQGLPEFQVQREDGTIHTWTDRDGVVRDYVPRSHISNYGKS